MTIAWIVYEDKKRDYTAAEDFGEIKVVFSAINRNFDPDAAIQHARRVLSKMEEGDYLVMSGDPTLCGICVEVAAEMLGEFEVLRWDRNLLSYFPMRLNFT